MIISFRFIVAVFFASQLLSISVWAAGEPDPSITIVSGQETRHFSRSQLLRSSELKKLEITNDPTYKGQKMVYDVVPLVSLFKGLKFDPASTLLFSCLDGFSAPISIEKVMSTDSKKSRAFIAIEAAAVDKKWPPLKNGKSAGPFYLVWETAEQSQISNEEWPFQLASFTIKPPIAMQYPHILLAIEILAQDPIRKGYESFLKNCFACHTLNGEGAAQMGPDLNIPMNPTEYFKSGYIEKLVRNPQSLRRWQQSKMSSFDRVALTDEELHSIILYLQHMAKRKVASAKKP